ISKEYYTRTAESNVDDDDIYYEIDSMTGFNPNPSSLVDVQNMFQTHKSNGHNIKFFYTNDQKNLTPVTTLGMWSGSGTVNLGTDYDSIKAYNFGIASERPVIGGSQDQSIIAGAGTLTQTVEANGVTITTRANSATGGVNEGTLMVRVKLSLPSGGTITVGTPTQPYGHTADNSL